MAKEINILLKPEMAMMYARHLKSYCARQKSCENCVLYRPKRHPYDYKCAISNSYVPPEGWDLDKD